MKLKGYLLAAVAAAAYGTNPLFAIHLYEAGFNPTSGLLCLLKCVLSLAIIFFYNIN